jgi:16S rRNA (cytosine967-C5)-methyltransferase
MPDAARSAAYDVLRAVRTEDAYANLVLPRVLADRHLEGRDAAFATELAAGTLRGQGTYDAIIDDCVPKRPQARLRDVLRLGAHQLLAMRVPTHAAVSATVDLAKARTGPRSAGLVNAVLRRIGERTLEEWVAALAPSDETGRLALAHSHPTWVIEALRDAVGPGEIEALLAADNQPPRVTLVARPGLATVAELPGEPTRWSPYGVVAEAGDPGAVPAVREGRAGVQDEGSQLVALALTNAPLEGRDERWLDACAGPGGKAALLQSLGDERGVVVVGAERQPHRAGLVRRAGVRRVLVADGTRPPYADGTFDRVLVDAPCSGLGALRRRPEARWRRTPEDLAALVPLQRALLASALDCVRPGGLVLYATCSPVLAETRDVVAATLDRAEADLVPIEWGIPDSDGPIPGTRQLWPHRHHTDAMFLALLRRSAK